MHVAAVLRLVKFPGVSNRRQQTVDGRAWQITKVEAPFCWVRPHGSGEPLRQYLVEVEQLCGPRHGRRRQPGPEPVSEPEAVSAPIPAPREQDDQRLYRNPRGNAPLSLILVGVRLHRAFSPRRIEPTPCRALPGQVAAEHLDRGLRQTGRFRRPARLGTGSGLGRRISSSRSPGSRHHPRSAGRRRRRRA